MFHFGKKKNQDEAPQYPEEALLPAEAPRPKKGKMDSLIMGAILGVAVGSVVGAAVTSRKGKETIEAGKKMIEEKQVELKKKKGIVGKIFGLLINGKSSYKKQPPLPLKKIPNERPSGEGSTKDKNTI